MSKASSRKNAESGGEVSSMCRQQRNIAEKQRRNKLNSYINELSTIVPFISHASKRLDKTSILRLAAAHIRMHKNIIKNHKKNSKLKSWRPSFINVENLKELLEGVEGFIFISSNTGKIIYISSSVERFLGHQNIDMMGHSLLNFVHPADVEIVQSQLLALSEAIDKGESVSRCSFHCRIREKSQARSVVVSYQVFMVTAQLTYQHGEDEIDQDEESCSSKALLKAFVQIVHSSPLSQVSLRNSISDEYVTYHDVNGRIIEVDQNISIITGHMPEEVLGKSAFDYIIPEDLVVTLFAQKIMFSSSNGRGLVVYRLRTITGVNIYLMSSGFLHFEPKTGQISHFVCINRLLSEEVGAAELKKFCLRYTPHALKESDAPDVAISSQPDSSPTSDDLGETPIFGESLSPHQPLSVEMASPNSTSSTADSSVFAETQSTLAMDDVFNTADTHFFPSDIGEDCFAEMSNTKDSLCSDLQNGSSTNSFTMFDGDNDPEDSLFFSDVFKQVLCSEQTLNRAQQSFPSPLQFVPSSSIRFH